MLFYRFLKSVGSIFLSILTSFLIIHSQAQTDLELELKHDYVLLPDGRIKLALSFFTDAQHNYVVEFRDDLGVDPCRDWLPLPNAPHNYGIVFTFNAGDARIFRLRRIDAPQASLYALLSNDTGVNSRDGVTSDPSISGLALQFPTGTSLEASLDHSDSGFSRLTDLGKAKYFGLTKGEIESINTGPLSDGPHIVFLRAKASDNSILATTSVPFTLVTQPPVLTFDLAAAFDSPPPGDSQTTFSAVTFQGRTMPGARVELEGLSSTTADGNGDFKFENLSLSEGANPFTIHATDAACNTATLARTFTRTVAPPPCPLNPALAGWDIFVGDTLGSALPTAPGAVVFSEPCSIAMTEGDSFLTTLSRNFMVPASPSMLALTLKVNFDTTTANAIHDAFEVAFIDNLGRSLLPTIQGSQNGPLGAGGLPPSVDSLFNFTEGASPFFGHGTAFMPSGTIPQASTLYLDLSQLAVGSSARLVLRLINNDNDHNTSVSVADAQVVPLNPSLDFTGTGAPAISLLTSSSGCGDSVSLAASAQPPPVTTGGLLGITLPAGGTLATPTLTINSPLSGAHLPTGRILITGSVIAGQADIPTGPNLVENGSFETYAIPPANWGFPNVLSANVLPGSADLASWTILDEPIDVVGSTNPGWVAHDGNISLDLAGTPGAGVIQQTFSTQPGKAYSVSFWFSGNPDSLGLFPDESTLMQMRVSVGAEDRLFTFDTAVEKNTLSDMKWKQYSFTFVATESLSTLQFRNENGRVYAGPALDSVSVYELATPNRITSITVNRTPAGSLDASGNFFAGFNLNSGANPIEVVATDSYGQQTTAKIAVFGSPCPEGFLAFSPANALPVYGEASFNEATKVLYTELALQNTSANLLHGPFFLGISDISDPSIVPLSSDATSSDGEPLYNFTGALSAGVLNPEALTAYRALAFLNPNRVPFTYKPTLLVPVNQAPFFVSVPLIEAAATALYAYAARASDPDGDALSYRLVKGPPGMTIDANSGLVQWNPTAQDIGAHSVSLSVSDGRGGSGAQSFTLAVLSSSGNQAPIISSSPGLSVPVRQNYSYDVAASDPDGDSITFSLVTAPAGMTVDLATGIIRWATSLSDVGPHPVQLRVTDSHSAFTDQSFTIQVTAPAQDTQAPVVYLSIVVGTSALLGPEVTVNRGTTVEFRVDATDNVGVIERALTVAGVPVSLDSSGRAMLTMNSVSISAVFAAAKDAAGNTGTASRSIRVIDPLDAHEPLITIHSPANSTLVSALTDIIASISDPVLESYHVDFAQFDQIDPAKLDADDSAWINISHGAGQVEHAAVGKFDPTILLNDSYVIRVVAQNINGRIRAEGVIVDLVNNLKFGEFRLQFTDLTIPLAGIPIQVGRVYDSRTSRDKGDFGFGWTLGVRDARITEIRKVPYAGLDGDSTFTTSTRIYLNTPDGRRVGFNFTPQLCSIGFFGPVYAPAFTADPGVYETLEADSALCAYKVDSDGRFIDSFGLVGFDPSVYRLTMKDGTVYKYDQTGGLQNITDLNGNKIAFSATGISHFQSGQSSPDTSIRFVRDGEGRITSIIDPTGHELRYAYDAGGDLRSFADQVNNLTHYTYSSARSHYLETLIDPLGHQAIKTEYDEAGRIKSITDAAGNKVSQDFDLAQNIGTYTNGRGTVTFSQFDDRGNEVLKWLPGIYTNRFEFDANNNLTRGVNGRGHNTNYVYDAKGNITTIKDAFGHLTSITYNDQNKPTQILNALNQSITLNYDSQGNLLKVVNNAGFETTMTRDSMGRLTSVKDAAGNTTQFNYDGGCSCGKPGKVINADGSFRLYSYNEFGQTTSAINELGAETKSEYDDSGRLLSVTDPLGNKTSYQYSGLLVTAMTDALGRTTHYEYDSQNRTNKVVDPAGGVVQFKYDANGNRTKVVDPVGNVTSFVYDAANRLTQEINTFGDKRLYAYDETGNRVQTIDRNGRKRTFDYDELNRMVAEKWWDGPSVIRTILFAFNALGVQTLASDPAARYDYTYDSLNRLTQVAQSAVPGQPDFTLNYTYTPLGQVESATDNYGVRVGSLYDNRNRLSTRTWQGGGIDPARVDFAYDPVGNRTRTDRFSDLAGAHRVGHSTFAYNQASTLSNITHRGPADEILAQYDYTFDAAYQITHWLIDGGNSDFSYDANGQLTGAVNTAQPNEIFKYDANGNRVGAQSAGNYVTGADNRINSDGTYSYSYDKEGNLVGRSNLATSASTVYEFDHRNRLVSVTDIDSTAAVVQSVTFAYDAINRRLAKTVNAQLTRFLSNGSDSWADLDGFNTVIARYLRGPRIDELVARQRREGSAWYLTDNLGTVRDIANATGTVVAHIIYGSFGQVLNASSPATADRFTFTGRELDSETRLLFYRARYFSSLSGIFISPDPSGFQGGDWNLYRYAGNSPVIYSDPSGRSFLEYAITGTLGALVSGTITAAYGGSGDEVAAASICGGLGALAVPLLFGEAFAFDVFAAGTVNEIGAEGLDVLFSHAPKAAIALWLSQHGIEPRPALVQCTYTFLAWALGIYVKAPGFPEL